MNPRPCDRHARRVVTGLRRLVVSCCVGLVTVCCVADGSRAAADVMVASPDGNVQFKLLLNEPRARYTVTMKNVPVVEPSPVGMTIDGVDIIQGATSGAPETYQVNETYPYRGVHTNAVNHCNGVKVPFVHATSNTKYAIEARAYNDGVAFRIVAPGEDGQKRTPDESSAFVVPQGSTPWGHNMRGHYEGDPKRIDLSAFDAGEWVAPPMTYKLPGGAGYASITEAAIMNYSAMALEHTGNRTFVVGLGHRQPVSYPFELRYKDDIERLKLPAVVVGTISTPWRVVMVGPDLNTLVNSDLVPNCAPPPDPALFPDGVNTAWIKPGRAVWRYVDGGDNRDNRLEEVKTFSDLAGKLGFEYNVLEGFWSRFNDEELADAVNHAKQRNVRLIVWRHSNGLRTPAAVTQFFDRLQKFGVAGAKIDFFDHDHKEVIDLYPMLLEEAAKRQLVIDFHGSGKPAGETRTWPNELIRESIHGMEARIAERATHETALPFTRFLAGPGEYTVVHFGFRRGDTTAAHQIATAAIFTAPLLTYAIHPQKALDSPAVDMFKAIPATWDETRALPPSEIGELAVFARRKGNDWFLAIANGPQPKSVKIPLTFLGDGEYKALVVKDGPDDGSATTTQPTTALDVQKNVPMKKTDTVALELGAGGGYIAKFSK